MLTIKLVEGLSKTNVTPMLTRRVAFTRGLSSLRKANLTAVAGAMGATRHAALLPWDKTATLGVVRIISRLNWPPLLSYKATKSKMRTIMFANSRCARLQSHVALTLGVGKVSLSKTPSEAEERLQPGL